MPSANSIRAKRKSQLQILDNRYAFRKIAKIPIGKAEALPFFALRVSNLRNGILPRARLVCLRFAGGSPGRAHAERLFLIVHNFYAWAQMCW